MVGNFDASKQLYPLSLCFYLIGNQSFDLIYYTFIDLMFASLNLVTSNIEGMKKDSMCIY